MSNKKHHFLSASNSTTRWATGTVRAALCAGAVPLPHLPDEPAGPAQHGRDGAHGAQSAHRGARVRRRPHRQLLLTALPRQGRPLQGPLLRKYTSPPPLPQFTLPQTKMSDTFSKET